MRERILKAMGLNEESLAELSAEQRAAIECVVNQEIQKRLAAERVLDEDDPTYFIAAEGIGAHMDQPLATPNVLPNLAVLQIIETADPGTSERQTDEETS